MNLYIRNYKYKHLKPVQKNYLNLVVENSKWLFSIRKTGLKELYLRF